MSPETRLILLAATAIFLFAGAAWVLFRVRVSPEEKEVRRRTTIGRMGRMTDGMMTDASHDALFYTYEVMGVEYTTSQDVGALVEHLPDNRNSLIGPVTVKYLPRNPANSIALCESWSGLRPRHQTPNLIMKEGEVTS